jgi:hypothetical protein
MLYLKIILIYYISRVTLIINLIIKGLILIINLEIR